MLYTIVQREEDNGHVWISATTTCSLGDPNDALVKATAALVRKSYGEEIIISSAIEVMAAEIVDGTFQMEYLVAAIRASLPNPDAEGDKPPALTTYRSQSAEMVAKGALAAAYQFEYPAAPQEGTPNPNQPILGFDGWAMIRGADGGFTLVLIQTKATEDQNCPPREAHKLANECRCIPRDKAPLCRALSVLARLLQEDPLLPAVMKMLELLGRDRLPDMHIAPVIVRGTPGGQIDDLQPIRQASTDFSPATGRGMVVSIGVPLADFGKKVMQKARETA